MRNNSVYPDDITEEQTTGTRKNAPLFEIAACSCVSITLPTSIRRDPEKFSAFASRVD
jgi:hypothetical protein